MAANVGNELPDIGGADAGSEVSSVFDDGYDSAMLGDAEDVKRLDEMTELAREKEIYKRTEQRALLMRQFEVKKKILSFSLGFGPFGTRVVDCVGSPR